jgi:hypothetical protein
VPLVGVTVDGGRRQVVRTLESKPRLLFGVAFTLAAAFVLLGPARSPMIWIDEVFYAEAGRSLAAGQFGAPIFGGLRGLDHAFHFQPPGFPLTLAAVYSVAGVSPLSTRLPGMLAFLGLGLAVAALLAQKGAREGLSPLLPVLGASLVWFDPWLLSIARSGRPDMLALLFAFGGVCLVSGRGASKAVGGGALAGLAGLVHPVVGVSAAGLALSQCWRRTKAGLGRAGLVSLGVGVALLPWMLWVLSDLPVWEEQFLGHVAGAATIADSSGENHRPVYVRPFEHLWGYFRVMPATVLLASLVLRPRWLRGVPALVGVLGVVALCLAAAENFSKFATPFLYPLLALGWARALANSEGRRRTGLWAAALLVLANLLALCLLKTGVLVTQWNDRDPARLDALMARHSEPGDVVLVMPETYFAALNSGTAPRYWSPLRGLRVTPSDADRAALYERLRADGPRVLIAGVHEDPPTEFGEPAGACLKLIEEFRAEGASIALTNRPIYGLNVWSVDWDCRPSPP